MESGVIKFNISRTQKLKIKNRDLVNAGISYMFEGFDIQLTFNVDTMS